MDFHHYQPCSDQLREFIDFFYFHETKYEEPLRFYAFPHYYKPLNIHRGIDHEIGDNTIHVNGSEQLHPKILLQGVYTEPILVRFSGNILKLTIIFKDGALSNFIPENFAAVAADHTQVFEAWDHIAGYKKMVRQLFLLSDHAAQLQLIESFLLSVLCIKEDWELYQKASRLLKDLDERLSISEIAKRLFLSERTLHRLVFKYNGVSPNNFKKIAQFRHSMQTKIVADNFRSLTDIAYSCNYYDASYFNRIYRSLTQRSPKAFFNNVAAFCDNKMIFEPQ